MIDLQREVWIKYLGFQTEDHVKMGNIPGLGNQQKYDVRLTLQYRSWNWHFTGQFPRFTPRLCVLYPSSISSSVYEVIWKVPQAPLCHLAS